MQQAASPRQAKDQQRPVTRFDNALLNVVITKQPRVAGKVLPLLLLLRVRLDDFDTGNGFRQPCVHHAELLALRHADGLEPPVVVVDRDHQRDGEQSRDEQQPGVEPPDHDHRNHQAHQRVDEEHNTRAEHRIEHPHVVGGARHDVADALSSVESLAFPEQADVEFVAGVSLDALRDERGGKVAEQSRHSLTHRGAERAQGHRQQRCRRPSRRRNHVEALPDKDLDVAVGRVIEDRTDDQDQWEKRVAHHM